MSKIDRPARDEDFNTAKEDLGRRRPRRLIVVLYFEFRLRGLVKVDAGNRDADSTCRDRGREAGVLSGLGVMGETMGLSEIGVGGRARSRSSGSRMYAAYISVFSASKSVELSKALCSAEVDATVMTKGVPPVD